MAERYGDLVFDFPWINDFSAARNAVIDRATGKWFFTVDTDEYLDEDISKLVEAMQKQPPNAEFAREWEGKFITCIPDVCVF